MDCFRFLGWLVVGVDLGLFGFIYCVIVGFFLYERYMWITYIRVFIIKEKEKGVGGLVSML